MFLSQARKHRGSAVAVSGLSAGSLASFGHLQNVAWSEHDPPAIHVQAEGLEVIISLFPPSVLTSLHFGFLLHDTRLRLRKQLHWVEKSVESVQSITMTDLLWIVQAVLCSVGAESVSRQDFTHYPVILIKAGTVAAKVGPHVFLLASPTTSYKSYFASGCGHYVTLLHGYVRTLVSRSPRTMRTRRFQAFLEWLERTFDCRTAHLELSPIDLIWIATEWAVAAESVGARGQRPLELTYTTPHGVEGITTIKFSVDPATVRELRDRWVKFAPLTRTLHNFVVLRRYVMYATLHLPSLSNRKSLHVIAIFLLSCQFRPELTSCIVCGMAVACWTRKARRYSRACSWWKPSRPNSSRRLRFVSER